ncbi:MAG: glycosidase, partial [bacterium]
EYIWIEPRVGMWDSKKVGIAAPPIKTKDGWILFYHGVSDEDGFYRLGVCLLDLKDPMKVIARFDEPIFEPETKYELEGQIPNVVFPCGIVKDEGKFFIYYGGADSVIGVATVDENELLKSLKLYK